MKTDVKSILPEEGEIPFSSVDGTEYSISDRIPADAHLEVIDEWDALMPYMISRGQAQDDTPEAVENRAEVLRKADKAARKILSMMARDKYPFMTAEWFRDNLDGLELMGLSTEVMMMASDFFVRRQHKLARLEKRAQAITDRVRG